MNSLPKGSPPVGLRPFWARLTAKAGLPQTRLVTRGGASVMVVPGRYSVTYLLVAAEAVVVVDIGSVTDHPRIFAALDWLGRPRSEVSAVVPTHFHMDHIIGIDPFARSLGVPVLLGRVAYDAVTRGTKLRYPRRLHLLRALPTYVMQGAPSGALVDWRVGLGFGFPWSDNRFQADVVRCEYDRDGVLGVPGWRLLHTPGHADDAVCLYHEQGRMLIAGDTVRNFLGGEWNPLLCDRDAYDRSKERLRQLEVDVIFPGHGPLIEGPDAVGRLKTLPRFMP